MTSKSGFVAFEKATTRAPVHFYDFNTRTLYKGDGTSYIVEFDSIEEDRFSVIDRRYDNVYIFDESGRHLETRTPFTDNVQLTIAYDGNGFISTITDNFSNTTTINRNGSGEPTSITSPYSQVTTLTLNSHGRLYKIANPLSEEYEITYHNFGTGLMETFKKPEGQVNTFNYDSLGQLASDVRSSGKELYFTTTRSGFDKIINMTTGEGRSTTFEYVDIDTVYDYTKSKEFTSVDGVERTSEETDTSLEFTEGEMTYSATYTNGAELYGSDFVSVSTVSNGDQTATFNFSNSITYSYPRGSARLVGGYAPLPLTPKDPTSYTRTMSVPWGGYYEEEISSNQTSIVYTTPELLETTYTRDATTSRITSIDGPATSAVTFSYDSNGRLDQIPQGTRDVDFAYNSGGFLFSMTNELSQTTSYEYDLAGRVTKLTFPNNDEVDLTYDGNGNLTSIKPPGRSAYQYVYGSATEFLDQMVPPTLSGITDPTTYYYYDDDGVLSSVTRPDGSTLAYSYVSNTELVSAITDGTDSFTVSGYDSNGLPNDITSNYDLKSIWTRDGKYIRTDKLVDDNTSLSYGEVNFNYTYLRPASVNVKNRAGTTVSTISYTLNNDSTVTDAGDMEFNISSTTGLIDDLELDNMTADFTYNGFAEILTYDVEYSSTSKYSYTLTRDGLGRIDTMTEVVLGTSTVYDYDYDSNGRLTEVKTNTVVTSDSTYGTNSTRTSGQVGGVSFTATYDAHDRLTDWNDLDFSYNDNGEMISKTDTSTSDVTTYGWDNWGRLNTVTLPNSDVIAYEYDGAGRKAFVKLNGTLQYSLLYQSQYQPVAQMDSSGDLIARFVWGTKIQTPEYMIKGGNKYIFVTDPRGSVRLVIKSDDGTVAQRMDYDEWGNVTNDTNPGFQPFGFAGGLYDYQTGLVEFGARHYYGLVGRWLSKDPISFEGADYNLFSYTYSDPVNYIDSNGLIAAPLIPIVGGGIGAIVGGVAGALNAPPGCEFEGGVEGAILGFGTGSLGGVGVATGSLIATIIGSLTGSAATGLAAAGSMFSGGSCGSPTPPPPPPPNPPTPPPNPLGSPGGSSSGSTGGGSSSTNSPC